MWIARRMLPKLHKSTSTAANHDSTAIYCSQRLDRINKPLPPIITAPLTFVVIGNSNIGNPTFIQLALPNAQHSQQGGEVYCSIHLTYLPLLISRSSVLPCTLRI